MGTKRLGSAAAWPRAVLGSSDSSQGSASATPAPRSTLRRVRWAFVLVAMARPEGVVDDDFFEQVAQRQASLLPARGDLIEVRLAAGGGATQAVGKQLFGCARDVAGIFGQR